MWYFKAIFHFNFSWFAREINTINLNRYRKGGYDLFMLLLFIYEYWYTTRFPRQMMSVSLNSNMTGFTSGPRTAKPPAEHVFTPGFSGVRVARSLVFLFIGSINILSYFSSLYCLFDLQLLNTPLYQDAHMWSEDSSMPIRVTSNE